MPGPLDGIRVIDITTILSGPYGSQWLGDLGADVIKVEGPPRGDSTRYLGRSRNPGMSGPFLNTNRNKRSIQLDLKHEAGKQVLRDLLAQADVLLHNMRPKAINRLGFSYEEVVKIKPDIIYCGAYGFSQKGRNRDLPAYDDLIQSLGGLSHLFIETTGEARFAPTVMVDKLTGILISNAIGMALFHRERSGEGQQIEVPMYESMVSFMMVEHLYEHAFEPPLGPFGYKRLTTPLRAPNKASDGYVTVLPYTDKQWSAFFEIAGLQHLKDDPRFENHSTRNENIHEIYGIMRDVMASKTVDEWVTACRQAQIPAAPVASLEDIFNDPHLADVGLFERHNHPTEGEITLAAMPLGFSKTPGSIRRMAPRLGENGAEILAEIGYDEARISGLAADGALIMPEK